jgi:methyl-accepting chemotaxis protein
MNRSIADQFLYALENQGVAVGMLITLIIGVFSVYLLAFHNSQLKKIEQFISSIRQLKLEEGSGEEVRTRILTTCRQHANVELALETSRCVLNPSDAESIVEIVDSTIGKCYANAIKLKVFPNILMMSGLVGTIFGLVAALSPLAEQLGKFKNPEEIPPLMQRALTEMQGALFARLAGIVLAGALGYFIQTFFGNIERLMADAQTLYAGRLARFCKPPTDLDSMAAMRSEVASLTKGLDLAMKRIAKSFEQIEAVTGSFQHAGEELRTSTRALSDSTDEMKKEFADAVNHSAQILKQVEEHRQVVMNDMGTVVDQMRDLTDGNHKLIQKFEGVASSHLETVNESREKILSEFQDLSQQIRTHLEDHRASNVSLANDVKIWQDFTSKFGDILAQLVPSELNALSTELQKLGIQIEKAGEGIQGSNRKLDEALASFSQVVENSSRSLDQMSRRSNQGFALDSGIGYSQQDSDRRVTTNQTPDEKFSSTGRPRADVRGSSRAPKIGSEKVGIIERIKNLFQRR